MTKAGFHILRVGLGITFLWIGVLIFKQPESWGGYLNSWAVELLPVSISQAMIGIAVLDIVIGFLFLIDMFTWLASLLAIVHLVIILTVSGITDITVRNIAILAGAIVILIDSLPKNFFSKFNFFKK